MKKRLTKFVVLALSGVIAVSSFNGCDSNSHGQREEIDTNKTQIFINHYLGGVGEEWLDGKNIVIGGKSFKSIKERFESEYADYQLDGKTGVQLIVNNQKQGGDALYDTIDSATDEVYFMDKSKFNDMKNNNKIMDISAALTETTYKLGKNAGKNINADGKAIETRLSDISKSYFNYSGYKALPNYETFGGLNYNINVFDSNSLYFAKGGCPSEYDRPNKNGNDVALSGSFADYNYTNLAGEKSAGPDGKYGTYDDGLPATYDEFFTLCDHMMTHSVTPFIWSGTYGKAYMNELLSFLRADFEGPEQMRLVTDPDGWEGNENPTVNHVVKFNSDGSIAYDTDSMYQFGDGASPVVFESPVALNNENGYLLFHTGGMYYATYFLGRMLSNSGYLSGNVNNAQSHTDAQAQFVLSEFDGNYNKKSGGQQIAMLVEGNYWFNEVRDYGAFKTVEGSYSAKLKNAPNQTTNYGLLPVPKVNSSYIGEKTTISAGLGNITVVSSKVAESKKPLIIEFLKYCYSDESTQDFVAITGMPRGLEITLDEEHLNCLPSYCRSVWDMRTTANYVQLVSDNMCYRQSQSYWDYTFSTSKNSYLLDQFTNGESLTAEAIFKQICEKRNASSWTSEFSPVLLLHN